jgi:hypothetical protein
MAGVGEAEKSIEGWEEPLLLALAVSIVNGSASRMNVLQEFVSMPIFAGYTVTIFNWCIANRQDTWPEEVRRGRVFES